MALTWKNAATTQDSNDHPHCLDLSTFFHVSLSFGSLSLALWKASPLYLPSIVLFCASIDKRDLFYGSIVYMKAVYLGLANPHNLSRPTIRTRREDAHFSFLLPHWYFEGSDTGCNLSAAKASSMCRCSWSLRREEIAINFTGDRHFGRKKL